MVRDHPNCSVFHSAAWAKVLATTYGHLPLYLQCSRKNELLALVPLMEVRSRVTGVRGVGLPFTDVCTPLLFGDCEPSSVLPPVVNLAKERNWKHFELRGGVNPGSEDERFALYYEHTIDLRHSEEIIFSNFSSSTRRAIRKAENSNLRFEMSSSEEALNNYYNLHLVTRKRHGVPPQPFTFFQNIHSHLIKAGHGSIALAFHSDQPVSGGVYLRFGKHSVYKFGASDETHQIYRGNNLVMWRAIEALKKEGIEYLHLGRTSRINSGLRNFKMGWGAVESRLGYLKFKTATKTWVNCRDLAGGFHNLIFKRMPSSLNRLVGTLIYPHLD